MPSKKKIVSRIAGLSLSVLLPCLALAITPTTTTLSTSPSGPVTAGTVVTLTATVTAAGSPVTRGLVIFCNAARPHCLDSAILGQAQLTSSGSAKTKLRPGIGEHSIKAVFQGTTLFATSPSVAASMTVTGTYASSTAVSISGTAGAYTFEGTVGAFGPFTPTGTVSFVDANHGNTPLGSVPLTAEITSRGFLTEPVPVGPGGVGDLNGDGLPDLVAVGSSIVEVWLSNGDGTFTRKSTTEVGRCANRVTTGDFNADGITDLAIPDGCDSTVTVLIGNGDGTFTTKLPLNFDICTGTTVADVVFTVVVADINNDGIPDLATNVATCTDSVRNVRNGVTAFLGNGDGTFTHAFTADFPFYPVAIVTGDLNGDGIPDLAVASLTAVTALLGNGDGTFTAAPSISVGTSPTGDSASALVIGDFNGDGIPDLATNSNPATVTVLMGNGDGTFTAKLLSINSPFYNLASGDFTGDGVTDLVANGLSIVLLSGKGDGTFTTLSTAPGRVTPNVADFNGDGIADLAGSLSDNKNYVFLAGFRSILSVTSPLQPGPYKIIASYSGDSHYAPSSSQPLILTTATPVVVPQPGIYAWTQKIAITDATPDAVIYYTLDGTTPTKSSTIYASPITIGWDGTINAFAVSPGAIDTPVVTATYSIVRPMQPPEFSLPSGTYTAPQTITLTAEPSYCSHAICPIYYTRNGSTPTTGSTKYTGPIVLNTTGTTTIKAIATSHHFKPSSVASATYTLH